LGLACAAQLEARRVGVRRPAKQDSWKPGRQVPPPRGRPVDHNRLRPGAGGG
jgi:hypothetical protein